MRLGLGHPMQIEACLDPVQTTLQPFGIGAVDPGEPVESREGEASSRGPRSTCAGSGSDRGVGAVPN